MYPLYKDLRTRLGTPLWIDQHGVPRYEPFHPDLLGIYDKVAVLLEVECQACGETFRCGLGFFPFGMVVRGIANSTPTLDDILSRYVHWGDAPWHDSDGDEAGFETQCAGTTMTTDWRVLEVWEKINCEWLKRDHIVEANEMVGEDQK